MLVRFSVENFKSIREEQTLSMVASNYEKDLPENVIQLDIPGMKGVNLLKSAVIYGANASGKSNVLKALDYMKWFVAHSVDKPKPANKTRIDPFLLDKDVRHQPSTFEITILLHNEFRVDYGFSVTAECVQEEWLTMYPKGRAIEVFHRHADQDKDKYKFSSKFKINKSLKNLTRADALFLTVATQYNVSELAEVYSWFELDLVNLDKLAATDDTQVSAYTNPTEREKILRELCSADTGIVDLSFGFETRNGEKYLFTQFSHKLKDPERDSASITFNRDMESVGTIRYFDLLGPLFYILDNRYCGFLDEADTSLHPHLVKKFISTIHNWKVKGGQLIFTTHDTTLLSADLFRRDQIWLTEKRHEGDTILYPLSDYKVRKGESLQKGYLAGRYGAIPFFGPEIETDG